MNYQTQKPVDLIERIISIASRPDDLVLDCFCGSGSTLVAAERSGRRWIGADLGRFAIHTSRKRLLTEESVRPFVVQNLGKYERQAWIKAEFDDPAGRAATETSYRKFILDLFRAEPFSGSPWLHGIKAGRLVHVGAVDAPVTLADVKAISAEIWKLSGRSDTKGATAAADILGWDFAFELNELAKQQAAESKVDLRFKRIPREVLEKAAVQQGDIGARDFFELRALSVKTSKKKRAVAVELTEFIIPPDDLPQEAAKTVTHWSQWIDYWAVDWNHKDDTFHNEWQSFRSASVDGRFRVDKRAVSKGTANRETEVGDAVMALLRASEPQTVPGIGTAKARMIYLPSAESRARLRATGRWGIRSGPLRDK